MEELLLVAAGKVIIDGKYFSFKLNFERNVVLINRHGNNKIIIYDISFVCNAVTV